MYDRLDLFFKSRCILLKYSLIFFDLDGNYFIFSRVYETRCFLNKNKILFSAILGIILWFLFFERIYNNNQYKRLYFGE